MHYEITDIQHPKFPELHRIRATEDLAHHYVHKGELGGYIEHQKNLRGQGWVMGDAIVRDHAIVNNQAMIRDEAVVKDYAVVTGRAVVAHYAVVCDRGTVTGDATVTYNSRVEDDADIYGSARLAGTAIVRGMGRVWGRVSVTDNAIVEGAVGGDAALTRNAHVHPGAKIHGTTWLGLDADVKLPHHTVTIGPIGFESVEATIYRSFDGEKVDARVRIGCWTGELDDMLTEVNRRRNSHWLYAKGHLRTLWYKQYRAMHDMGVIMRDTWLREESGNM